MWPFSVFAHCPIPVYEKNSSRLGYPVIFWIFISFYLLQLPTVKLSSVSLAVPDPDPTPDLNVTLTSSSRVTGSYSYQSYQQTIRCTASFPPFTPSTLGELQSIVLFALEQKLHLKVVGNLHSITDLICTDGVVVKTSEFRHFSLDPRTNFATAGAGLELMDLLEKLNEFGRGLQSAPAYAGVTLGGAIGTGAHGTSFKEAASLSDQLVSVTFVDGLGQVKKLSEGEEDFKALKVNLGLLGVVYEVVLRTTQQYKLEVRHYPLSDDILWRQRDLMEMAETNDHFQLFWFPSNKQVVMSVGNRVGVNASGNCESHLYTELPFPESNGVGAALEAMQATENHIALFLVQSCSKVCLYEGFPGRLPVFTEGGGKSLIPCRPGLAVGFGHRMITNRCRKCFWEQGPFSLITEDSSISIPVEELSRALRTVKEITDVTLVEFQQAGLLVRWQREGDAYMGMNGGRGNVSIDWMTVPRLDRAQPRMGITAFQAIGQALVEKHYGRPHWAKNGLYYSNPKIVHGAYPNLPKFVSAMRRLDPHGLFLNDFGRRIKFGSSDMTVTKESALHCALNEVCVCKRNSDCGNGGLLDLVCTDLKGFNVCRRRSTPLQQLKEMTERNTIDLIAPKANLVKYLLGALAPYKLFGSETG